EAAEAPSYCRLKPCRSLTDCIQSMNFLPIRFSFHRMLAGESRVYKPLYQAVCRIAHENRVWFSERLQTSGKIHRVAKSCNSSVCATYFPDHRRPSVKPDA